MSALMLLVAATSQPAPADEITVIARKLKDWRASLSFRDGKGECRIKRSTGDRDIDQIGCDAMLACWPQFQPRFDATRDRALAADNRRAMIEAANRDMAVCVEQRHAVLSAALAERRAGDVN